MSCEPDTSSRVRESIRTLTSLLHRFKLQKSPSKRPKDVLPFLQHFTTLLTCDDEDDPHAKKVIAATGSVSPGNRVHALVVAQNPHPVPRMEFKSVKKDKKTLTEVLNGSPNVPLLDHVADVWSALFAFDRTTKDRYNQLVALQLFFLSRSYARFAVRFRQDNVLCGGRRLHDIINEWQPDPSHHEISPKWVAPPGSLLDFPGLPTIKSRSERGQVEWEFSDETKQAWSRILAVLLLKVDKALVQTEDVRSNTNGAAEEVCQAMRNLEKWCRMLWCLVRWKVGVVKTLLTETNMVESKTTPRALTAVSETDDDDAAQFRQEPGESKGQQVYRYLNAVVAWHDAVHYLAVDATVPKLLENIEIGLVEVPCSPSSVLSLDRVTSKLVVDFSDLAESREEVERVLKRHYSDKFSGCAHAEATLMGLVNYHSHGCMSNPTLAVTNADDVWSIVGPVAAAGNALIAVSKKCCWCCDWLGRRLETQFQLPGTHGIMYPWDPPMVGISVSVLMELEKELWKELHKVVLRAVSPVNSRQSSPGIIDDMVWPEYMSMTPPY